MTHIKNTASPLAEIGVDIVKNIFTNEVVKPKGNELRIRPSGSFVYNIDTTQWYDHANDTKGNLITLYAEKNGLTTKEAYHLLMCKAEGTVSPSKRNTTTDKLKLEYSNVVALKREADELQKKIAKAKEIWDTTCENSHLDSGVEAYLNNRRIVSDVIPPTFRQYYWTTHYQTSPVINQWGKETSTLQSVAVSSDGLVAPIVLVQNQFDNDGEFTGNKLNHIGVHVIYLDGGGEKADIPVPKKSYGRIKGGAVHLTPFEELTDSLCLVEGIEDGLSVVQHNRGISCWAYLGTSNLKNIQIPKGVSEITLIRDNDNASEKCTNAFYHANKDKYHIKFLNPPSQFKDFNQMIMESSDDTWW